MRLVRYARKIIDILGSIYDETYLCSDVPVMQLGHGDIWEFLSSIANDPQISVIEIGSREVTGPSEAKRHLPHADYTGFDFCQGPNVDVVGDAHELSRYFQEDVRFDVIVSSYVWEHLAMPWIAAVEAVRMLKVGGVIAIKTHFAFGSHERPWHFFHCTDMGLKALFSPSLGVECIDSGMSGIIAGRYSKFFPPALRNTAANGLYAYSSFIGRKVREVNGFRWDRIATRDVVGGTMYPCAKSEMAK